MENPSLFVLLGFDTLYCINNLNLVPQNKAESQIVFCHGTHTQPDKNSAESDYPLGMGLFVKDSKFHFFGGENVEKPKDEDIDDDQTIDFGAEIRYSGGRFGLLPEDNIDSVIGFLFKRPIENNWRNKKVFSFTPPSSENSVISADYDSTPLPESLGYKVKPIVVTISKKIYALGTRPNRSLVESLVLKQREKNQILFEVFEPKVDNQWDGEWHWRELDNPPNPLTSLILECRRRTLRICHSVIKNSLFLQTHRAEYIFDTTSENWIYNSYENVAIDLHSHIAHNLTPCNDILAYLEYKDHLLLFVDYRLVAYDMSSFEVFKGAKGVLEGGYKTIFTVGDMVDNDYYTISAATLTLVDNNRICFVFIRLNELHVCLLEFTEFPCVKLIGKQVFDPLPDVLLKDDRVLSTYLFPQYEDSNQGSISDIVMAEEKDPKRQRQSFLQGELEGTYP